VQQECEAERPEEAQRDREEDEQERVADGDPEDLVLPELAEVVQADEARRADQVVLEEREGERDSGWDDDEESDPYEVGREQEEEPAPLAVADQRRPPTSVAPESASKK
jgi:hypothetical protein